MLNLNRASLQKERIGKLVQPRLHPLHSFAWKLHGAFCQDITYTFDILVALLLKQGTIFIPTLKNKQTEMRSVPLPCSHRHDSATCTHVQITMAKLDDGSV